MSNSDQGPNVTRREFSSALSLVWLFLMFAMGARIRAEPGWPSGLLFVATFVGWLGYTIASIRWRRTTSRRAKMTVSVLDLKPTAVRACAMSSSGRSNVVRIQKR